jgi:hypothetical protein
MNSIQFLKRFHPDRPWILTAIEPNQKGIETAAFDADSADAAEKWIDGYNGNRNIYFSVAEVIEPENKKATIANVKAVHWLHVDIDAQDGEDLLAELKRIKALVTTDIPDGAPKPTLVIYSGGGYQAFWELDQPIPIQGSADMAKEAARYNQQLELLYGGDSCHNVDRIMRLPGTMNLPNQRKLQKGRVPVQAEVEKSTKATHALTDFTQAADRGTSDVDADVQISGNIKRLNTVDDLDQWDVPDRVKVIIVQGKDPDQPKDGDNSRSAWVFDCACNLVRSDVPDDVIYSILTDPGFKIAESVLEAGDSDRYAKKQIKSAKEAAVSEWLQRLNADYAVIQNYGGKCLVIREVWDAAMKRYSLTKQSFTDFRNAYCNQFEAVPGANGNPKMVPVGKWWLEHPRRRQYERLVFAPGEDIPGVYNLWRGYGFNAIPGPNHESFLKHLHETVCCGNDEHYTYLIGWLARTVQNPAQPGHTAIVMRGRQGTGKSFFAKHFGRLFARHFLHISNAAHLVGNFNGHLRDSVVVFGDEAFYAGDKRHESVLKTLITEDSLMIETKGVDAEASPNYCHLILASNSDWVVPVGAGDRRYFVVDVDEKYARNTKHFGGIARDLERGGYENLLHYLMHYDLTDYEVQVIPDTDARRSQRQESMEPHEEWWMSVLEDGQLAGDCWAVGEEITAANSLVQDHYDTYVQNAAVHKRLTPTKLGQFLKRILPEGYPIKGKQRVDNRVENVRTFPKLEAARDTWDRISGAPKDWHDVSLLEPGADMPF